MSCRAVGGAGHVSVAGVARYRPRAGDRMRAKFPTAAIAVFGCTGSWDGLRPGSARLACLITPRDLPGRR